MKQNLTKILAETGKVSFFAALLLCAGSVQAGEPKYKVDGSTFQCITKMTPVKHFFADNLAGNLAGTVDVAKAGKGQFPEGTVLQLIPNEAMVKQDSAQGRTIGSSSPSTLTRTARKLLTRERRKLTTSWGSIASSAIRRRGRNSTSSASRIMAALLCRSHAKCSTPSSTLICVARLSSSAPRTPPR